MSSHERLKERYDAIYLSPHLDDVALSCGGQVYLQTEAGESILIVTVAAGEPDPQSFSQLAHAHHQQWALSAEEAVAARKAEDIVASRRLGADFLHWPFNDCIYRHHPSSGLPLYTAREEIFGEVKPVERPLVESLAQKMASLPPAGRVVAPLSIGNHVDHQLTRAAAERAFTAELRYYEDYPYAQQHPEAFEALLNPPFAWESEEISLTDEAARARLEAILQYRSQIRSLFGDEETLRTLLGQFIEKTRGERLWRRRAI